MLLNNQWVTEKNKEEVKSLETNENRSTMIQNLWDAADAVLTGSFIVISYLRKKKNLKQPKLTPKGTGEKRTKSKVSRRKEILKIRAETNDNSKPMGCSKSSSKREVYTNTILPQETRITSKR